MDLDMEIKLAKMEHEQAVLTARLLELKKQLLEAKRTTVTLSSESERVQQRIVENQTAMDKLLEQGVL